MGVLIFLLIILFVPFSLLLFVGGLGAMVGGEILSILLLPIALIVVFIVPPVIIIWGMNVVFRIKGSFVRRIEKKTLSDRFEQLKTPGNTLVLGGCPWKVVAVEGGKALIICMKAGKIRGMKSGQPPVQHRPVLPAAVSDSVPYRMAPLSQRRSHICPNTVPCWIQLRRNRW